MLKSELERALMRANSLEELAERARYLKEKYGDSGPNQGGDSVAVAPLHLPRGLPQMDEREIQTNDTDFVIRGPITGNVTHFVPEYRDRGNAELIRLILRAAKRSPGENQIRLLEGAINQLASRGELSSNEESLIDEAVQLLAEMEQPSKPAKSRRGK